MFFKIPNLVNSGHYVPVPKIPFYDLAKIHVLLRKIESEKLNKANSADAKSRAAD